MSLLIVGFGLVADTLLNSDSICGDQVYWTARTEVPLSDDCTGRFDAGSKPIGKSLCVLKRSLRLLANF